MRMRLAIMLFAALPGAASAADLREPGWGAHPPPARWGGYEGLWAEGGRSGPVAGPARPHRRVMGGPDYVGSNWGLGKPPVSGIGPRPDWGRSTYD